MRRGDEKVDEKEQEEEGDRTFMTGWAKYLALQSHRPVWRAALM